MDVDKVAGSGLSQTVLFSVVLFPLVAFVNNLLRPIDPINQNVNLAMAQNGSHSGSWELNYSDH